VFAGFDNVLTTRAEQRLDPHQRVSASMAESFSAREKMIEHPSEQPKQSHDGGHATKHGGINPKGRSCRALCNAIVSSMPSLHIPQP